MKSNRLGNPVGVKCFYEFKMPWNVKI